MCSAIKKTKQTHVTDHHRCERPSVVQNPVGSAYRLGYFKQNLSKVSYMACLKNIKKKNQTSRHNFMYVLQYL